jgi:hypothetical protein
VNKWKRKELLHSIMGRSYYDSILCMFICFKLPGNKVKSSSDKSERSEQQSGNESSDRSHVMGSVIIKNGN